MVLFGTPEESQLYRQEDFPAVALNPSPKRLSAPFVPIKTFSARGSFCPHESRRTPAMSAQTKLSINLARWWGLEPHSPSRSSASTYSSNQLFQSRNATRLRKWLVSIHILHRIVGHPFLKVSSQPTPKYNTKILYGSSIIFTFFHFFLSFSKRMYPL